MNRIEPQRQSSEGHHWWLLLKLSGYNRSQNVVFCFPGNAQFSVVVFPRNPIFDNFDYRILWLTLSNNSWNQDIQLETESKALRKSMRWNLKVCGSPGSQLSLITFKHFDTVWGEWNWVIVDCKWSVYLSEDRGKRCFSI